MALYPFSFFLQKVGWPGFFFVFFYGFFIIYFYHTNWVALYYFMGLLGILCTPDNNNTIITRLCAIKEQVTQVKYWRLHEITAKVLYNTLKQTTWNKYKTKKYLLLYRCLQQQYYCSGQDSCISLTEAYTRRRLEQADKFL